MQVVFCFSKCVVFNCLVRRKLAVEVIVYFRDRTCNTINFPIKNSKHLLRLVQFEWILKGFNGVATYVIMYCMSSVLFIKAWYVYTAYDVYDYCEQHKYHYISGLEYAIFCLDSFVKYVWHAILKLNQLCTLYFIIFDI